GNSLNDFFCYQCTCEFCGNGAHVGYNCPVQVPSFQTLPSFPQQYPCCKDCEVTHEPYQCQQRIMTIIMSKILGMILILLVLTMVNPLQYTVNHPIFNVHNDILTSQTTIVEQITQLTSMCETFCQIVQKKREEKQIEEEQAANAQNWKIPACCDDDDDYNSAITPNELVNSLSMGDKHLNTILVTELEEFIKSYVENLVPNPRINETDCHPENEINLIERLFYNNSFPRLPKEFVSENSDADIESFSHLLSPMRIVTLIDSLLDKLTGELTLLKSIPPRIDGTDCHPENEIHFTERLLYDKSSPRPPKEFVYENFDADIKYFSPSPIPNYNTPCFRVIDVVNKFAMYLLYFTRLL
nr:hypothetical protein [Tanacetum cinerariifolium]